MPPLAFGKCLVGSESQRFEGRAMNGAVRAGVMIGPATPMGARALNMRLPVRLTSSRERRRAGWRNRLMRDPKAKGLHPLCRITIGVQRRAKRVRCNDGLGRADSHSKCNTRKPWKPRKSLTRGESVGCGLRDFHRFHRAATAGCSLERPRQTTPMQGSGAFRSASGRSGEGVALVG